MVTVLTAADPPPWHGQWEESPDLDVTNEAAIESAARYDFAEGFGVCGRALDIGAGKCIGGRILAGNCTVVNLDIGFGQLSWGRKDFDGRGLFVCGDAVKLPFDAETFDLITAFEIIEHLPSRKGGCLLLEAKRVVKKEGIIIVSTPNDNTFSKSGLKYSPFHENKFSPSSFRAAIIEWLGPAEYYGLAPDYGAVRNLLRRADVFSIRHKIKKWLPVKSIGEQIEKSQARASQDPLEEILRRARGAYRITEKDFKRGRVLMAVFKKEG